MAQAQAAITAEVFDTWVTPNEALTYAALALSTDDGNEAIRAIWERLRGGLITAACSHSSRTPAGYGPTTTDVPEKIPSYYWDHFTPDGSNFWNGDARFYFPDQRGFGETTVIRCIGIKLDPVSLATTLPAPPSIPDHIDATNALVPNERPEPSRGSPVSDLLLSAWYKLYRQAYQGPADTLENAQNSARGMFPGKFVSRDRVRALCAGRKRGRKSRDSE